MKTIRSDITLKRISQYAQLKNVIRDSPLVSFEFQGNTYFFKLECCLPYGECHYARVFVHLLYEKERLGFVVPGDKLLETTSGSGGRAAAAVATAMGYSITIALPAGSEKAREESIVKAGGKLYLTSAKDYVNGFPAFVIDFLSQNHGTKYLNHVMGDVSGRGKGVNSLAVDACRPIAREVVTAGIIPDIVLCPLGNGTSTLALCEEFKMFSPSVKLIGFESVLSAFAHRRKFPGEYERIFGVEPDIFPRHDLPGTVLAKYTFPVPALETSIPMLDSVVLISSSRVDQLFVQQTGFFPSEKSSWIASWDQYLFPQLADFGRTGKAGFAAALKYAQKHGLQGKTFLIPVFDAAWHYDS